MTWATAQETAFWLHATHACSSLSLDSNHSIRCADICNLKQADRSYPGVPDITQTKAWSVCLRGAKLSQSMHSDAACMSYNLGTICGPFVSCSLPKPGHQVQHELLRACSSNIGRDDQCCARMRQQLFTEMHFSWPPA